jgi:hypothetical protein
MGFGDNANSYYGVFHARIQKPRSRSRNGIKFRM